MGRGLPAALTGQGWQWMLGRVGKRGWHLEVSDEIIISANATDMTDGQSDMNGRSRKEGDT